MPVDFIHAQGLEILCLTPSEFQEIMKNYITHIQEKDDNEEPFVIPEEQSLEFLQAEYQHQRSLMLFDWLNDWNPTPDDVKFLRIVYDSTCSDTIFGLNIIAEQVKVALEKFKQTGLIPNEEGGHHQFAAPLVPTYLGQYLYTLHLVLKDSNSNSFEEFLHLSIEHMKASELQKSLSHGQKVDTVAQKGWMAERMAIHSMFSLVSQHHQPQHQAS
ncbi:7123_t:CDS:2, partial [Paraglomus occultum]